MAERGTRKFGGLTFKLVNQEYSKRNAEGLSKHIRSIGGKSRITTKWGLDPRGRRVRIYTVWERL